MGIIDEARQATDRAELGVIPPDVEDAEMAFLREALNLLERARLSARDLKIRDAADIARFGRVADHTGLEG